MKKSSFEALLSFLLGSSWAFVIIGAFLTFKIFLFLGVVGALVNTFIFIFLALVLIAIIEALMIYKDNSAELKKQTELLQEIKESLKSHPQ
jgi:predicted RND superfamily exporter protein